ncbi:MAG TPA: hypothetical protein PLH72_04265 [Vicinamibacterales bacterium]|nr:hypothetical protein [Vicinamibacterales bacterium]
MRQAAALLALFAALAAGHTWPLASDLTGLSRLDNDDTGLNVWIIAWVAHVLPRHPLELFEAPMFYPEPHTLAYSEHMLVPGLLGAPLLWAGLSPVTVYNVLVLAGLSLSGWTMSLVVRRWTGSTAAGVVAGMLFAFNAHLLTRIAHLQALHVEFFPLALYAFDAALTRIPAVNLSATSAARPLSAPTAALALASAFVAQALCSNYSLVFLSAALLVAAVVRAPEWLGPGRLARTSALAGAGALAVLVVAPFLWPYFQVRRAQGLVRTIDDVRLYSAGWLDYLTTGGRLHYTWWSHRIFEGRTALFPGLAGVGLSAIGLTGRGSFRDPRVRMIAAIGLAGVALSLGPGLPGYAWLHTHVPLLQGIRAAARWGFLALMAVAVLGGYGVAALERRWRGSPYWPAVLLAILGVVTLEALRAPMGFVPFTGVPAIYTRLAGEPGVVLVELPLYAGPAVSENARYLVAATAHFRPLVNGYSGFETEAFRERAARWRGFPSDEVLDQMRALGVTRVMVHLGDLSPDQVNGAARSPRLDLEADDGERRLYRLR